MSLDGRNKENEGGEEEIGKRGEQKQNYMWRMIKRWRFTCGVEGYVEEDKGEEEMEGKSEEEEEEEMED